MALTPQESESAVDWVRPVYWSGWAIMALATVTLGVSLIAPEVMAKLGINNENMMETLPNIMRIAKWAMAVGLAAIIFAPGLTPITNYKDVDHAGDAL